MFIGKNFVVVKLRRRAHGYIRWCFCNFESSNYTIFTNYYHLDHELALLKGKLFERAGIELG